MLPPSIPAQIESLQAQVESLTADCAAQRDARVQAEQRLAALEAELAGACSALEEAKHTGTPKGKHLRGGLGGQGCCNACMFIRRSPAPACALPASCRHAPTTWSASPRPAGEAAKQVSKLALQRVRELQSKVEDARLEASAHAARIEALEAALEEEKQAAAAAAELEAASRELAARCDKLQHAVDQYRDSDAQLQDEIASLNNQKQSLNSRAVELSGEVRLVRLAAEP